MHTRNLYACLIAAAALLPAVPGAQAPQPRDRPFDVKLVMSKAPPGDRVYRVIQGDVAVLKLTSDRSGEVRVEGHGRKEVKSRTPAEMRVQADTLGRFEVEFWTMAAGELRPVELKIGTIEVRPR